MSISPKKDCSDILKENPVNNKEDKIDNNSHEFKIEKELCSHALNDDIINEINQSFNYFNETLKIVQHKMKESKYICFCLSCMERVTNLDELNKHFNEFKHKLYLNLISWHIICTECKSEENWQKITNLRNNLLTR